ncbi:MAG: hypothetical protein QXU32_06950 [Nitrososphaerales archaeon]
MKQRRRLKNWFTAMAVLFAVIAVIVIVRDLALFGPEFVADFFVNDKINNEKISLVMLAIAGVLFIIGLKKSEQLYREG